MALWDDEGPISQGKIITALLKDDESAARFMLRGWSRDDLDDLERAARQITVLCRMEVARRAGRPHNP